ncbi:MAG: hypothetical protein DLM57_09320, partial [Pseudonocardiales bacterium]
MSAVQCPSTGAAEWLAARPDIAKLSYPWTVMSFDGLEGLDENDLRAIALATGYVTDENEIAEIADFSRGDLVAVLAGWPWTATVRQQEMPAPPETPREEVVWWLDDLLDLLECRTEQHLIEHVRVTLEPLVSVIWSDEDALRIDVLAPTQSRRMEFHYPFAGDTFLAALVRPFDEEQFAWKPLSELKQIAVDVGYAHSVEELDDMAVTVSDLVVCLQN